MVRNSSQPRKNPEPEDRDDLPKISPMLEIHLVRAVFHGGIQTDQQLKQFLKEGRESFGLSNKDLLTLYVRKLDDGLSVPADAALAYRARLCELLYRKDKEPSHLSEALTLRRALILHYENPGPRADFYHHQYAYSAVSELSVDSTPPPDSLMRPLLRYGSVLLKSAQSPHSHINNLPIKCEVLVTQLIELLGYLHVHRDSPQVKQSESSEDIAGAIKPKQPKSVDDLCSIEKLRSELLGIMASQIKLMLSNKIDPDFWRVTVSGSVPLWGLRFMASYVERAKRFIENEWSWNSEFAATKLAEWRRHEAQVEELYDTRAWLKANPGRPDMFSKSELEHELKALREIMPTASEDYTTWRERMHSLQIVWWGKQPRSSRLGEYGGMDFDPKIDSHVLPHTLTMKF